MTNLWISKHLSQTEEVMFQGINLEYEDPQHPGQYLTRPVLGLSQDCCCGTLAYCTSCYDDCKSESGWIWIKGASRADVLEMVDPQNEEDPTYPMTYPILKRLDNGQGCFQISNDPSYSANVKVDLVGDRIGYTQYHDGVARDEQPNFFGTCCDCITCYSFPWQKECCFSIGSPDGYVDFTLTFTQSEPGAEWVAVFNVRLHCNVAHFYGELEILSATIETTDSSGSLSGAWTPALAVEHALAGSGFIAMDDNNPAHWTFNFTSQDGFEFWATWTPTQGTPSTEVWAFNFVAGGWVHPFMFYTPVNVPEGDRDLDFDCVSGTLSYITEGVTYEFIIAPSNASCGEPT